MLDMDNGGEHLVVTVRDTGIGIPESLREAVFEVSVLTNSTSLCNIDINHSCIAVSTGGQLAHTRSLRRRSWPKYSEAIGAPHGWHHHR